jgi:acyl carrier protein phosphodiesterase
VIGNLAADGLKGRAEHHGVLAEAIRRHRRIDALTDEHPAVGRSRRRLDPPYRHTARIIVDVFHDHFLARHWLQFSDEPLPAFCQRMYGIIRQSSALLPDPVRARFLRMTEEDWLGGYVDLRSITLALRGISRRLSRGGALEDAVDLLRADYRSFEDDFLEFFPQLILAVAFPPDAVGSR